MKFEWKSIFFKLLLPSPKLNEIRVIVRLNTLLELIIMSYPMDFSLPASPKLRVLLFCLALELLTPSNGEPHLWFHYGFIRTKAYWVLGEIQCYQR